MESANFDDMEFDIQPLPNATLYPAEYPGFIFALKFVVGTTCVGNIWDHHFFYVDSVAGCASVSYHEVRARNSGKSSW